MKTNTESKTKDELNSQIEDIFSQLDEQDEMLDHIIELVQEELEQG